jgi:hypothetical protein
MSAELERMAKYAVLLGSHGNEMQVGEILQRKPLPLQMLFIGLLIRKQLMREKDF